MLSNIDRVRYPVLKPGLFIFVDMQLLVKYLLKMTLYCIENVSTS